MNVNKLNVYLFCTSFFLIFLFSTISVNAIDELTCRYKPGCPYGLSENWALCGDPPGQKAVGLIGPNPFRDDNVKCWDDKIKGSSNVANCGEVTETRCQVEGWPTNTRAEDNGEKCTAVNFDVLSSSLTSEDGKWDYSQGQCVICNGMKDTQKISLNFQGYSIVAGDNKCESACAGLAKTTTTTLYATTTGTTTSTTLPPTKTTTTETIQTEYKCDEAQPGTGRCTSNCEYCPAPNCLGNDGLCYKEGTCSLNEWLKKCKNGEWVSSKGDGICLWQNTS